MLEGAPPAPWGRAGSPAKRPHEPVVGAVGLRANPPAARSAQQTHASTPPYPACRLISGSRSMVPRLRCWNPNPRAALARGSGVPPHGDAVAETDEDHAGHGGPVAIEDGARSRTATDGWVTPCDAIPGTREGSQTNPTDAADRPSFLQAPFGCRPARWRGCSVGGRKRARRESATTRADRCCAGWHRPPPRSRRHRSCVPLPHGGGGRLDQAAGPSGCGTGSRRSRHSDASFDDGRARAARGTR